MMNYVNEKYIIVTTPENVKKIIEKQPHARAVSVPPGTQFIVDETGEKKFLIDKYAVSTTFIKNMESNPKNKVVLWRVTKQSLEMLGIKSINEKKYSLDGMELVFKMGNLALEVQNNERESNELDTPYYEMGKIIKNAYEDMNKIFKGYYHE